MSKASKAKKGSTARVMLTLPRPLVAELAKYAAICRGGNKSGFVADAIETYIKGLRRHRHTQKLRRSYAAAAKQSLAIAQQWEHLDDEAWAQLDRLEKSANT